ncbi:MAG TPA: L,D-transpeptidase family protein [Gaiellaceae bacterium]|nr:L,D-transpeptidase family protein [Gaiellaceae bacterium]
MRAARDAWSQARGLLAGRIAIVVLVVLAVASAGTGAAYAYDRSHRDVIASGVSVDTIDLGGLSATQARAKLERGLAPLHRPLVLRYRGGQFVLRPQSVDYSLQIDATVQRALAVSRRSWFVPRAWRDLTGGKVQTSLRPVVGYSGRGVARAVRKLQRRVNGPPLNARVVPSAQGVTLYQSHPGRTVATGPLWHAIERRLSTPAVSRTIRVPVVLKAPWRSASQLRKRYPSYITIDRGAFKLHLFKHLRLVRTYPIAVGQAGLETPAGLYHIQDKSVNPSWQVPLSAWAGSLAGQLIPPGPDDPIKARWMGLFNGAGIHGTDETWSIGHAVSHGCVRMLIPDVTDLYDRVAVGTPVYIGD